MTNVLAKFCGKLRELSAQIAVKFFNLLPKQILTEADHTPGFFHFYHPQKAFPRNESRGASHEGNRAAGRLIAAET
jgi:hypothetical protein